MKRILTLFLATIITLFPVLPVSAFDPGFIISNEELFRNGTMTTEEIQDFLNKHAGILKNHTAIGADGLLKTAAMIIHDSAARYDINPQYLLVLLQKEQGLITDSEPWQSQLDWATGYAVCDSCDVNHPIVLKYKGFAKQLDRAAWRTRYYMENIHEFNYKPGFEYEIDGQTVKIANLATAALYNYTPHIRGNQIFARLWVSWFQDFTYPDNTLLKTADKAAVWLIKNGVRHPFTNERALTSRFPLQQILTVPPEVLEEYPVGAPIGHAQFSILKTPDGQRYLLVDDALRLIIDDHTFRQLGFTPDEVEEVAESELLFYKDGEPITPASLEPLGSLVQDPESLGIFFVKDGIKYPLIAPELLPLNYSNQRVRKGTVSELSRYALGSPVKLKEGLLVKTADAPNVYVISNGKKLPIDSEFTFNALGYNWENIEIVTPKLLDLHETGATISVEIISDEEASKLAEE